MSTTSRAILQWACACDLRFASSKALFRTAFLTVVLILDGQCKDFCTLAEAINNCITSA